MASYLRMNSVPGATKAAGLWQLCKQLTRGVATALRALRRFGQARQAGELPPSNSRALQREVVFAAVLDHEFEVVPELVQHLLAVAEMALHEALDVRVAADRFQVAGEDEPMVL